MYCCYLETCGENRCLVGDLMASFIRTADEEIIMAMQSVGDEPTNVNGLHSAIDNKQIAPPGRTSLMISVLDASQEDVADTMPERVLIVSKSTLHCATVKKMSDVLNGKPQVEFHDTHFDTFGKAALSTFLSVVKSAQHEVALVGVEQRKGA